MSKHPLLETLRRIEESLERAEQTLRNFTSGETEVFRKSGGDPVTDADRTVNELLRNALPRDDEAWLSEETTDDPRRLEHERVWVVDPLDGTKEFVAGIPEWSVSIAFVENGQAVAGGILNPQTGERFLGAQGLGVTLNGKPVTTSGRASLKGAVVLASRSEVDRGEWERFKGGAFNVQPMGSVAYKLARVAAGLADATWTLVPKHEWDVAAGTALVLAAGGMVYRPDGIPVSFNNRDPKLTGLVAHPPALADEIRKLIRSADR